MFSSQLMDVPQLVAAVNLAGEQSNLAEQSNLNISKNCVKLV
jgi:hypothetical protein